MPGDPTTSLRNYLHFAAALWKSDSRSDAELLRAFQCDKEEQAFAVLVGRHGQMVWNVCLRVLRNSTDAEDAFQAAFLRLARDAGRIRQPDSLAGWLFHTARCCALDLRRRLQRQRQRLQEWSDESSCLATPVENTTDLAACLDEEIQNLPLKSRTALVLCCLQGRSYKEAAVELGCSVATAHRWVLHARELLRRRLLQRGHKVATWEETPLENEWSKSSASVTPPLLAMALERTLQYIHTGALDASRAAALAAAGGSGVSWLYWLAGAGLALSLTLVGFLCLLPANQPVADQQAAPRPAPRAESTRPLPVAWPAGPLAVSGQIRDSQGQPCVHQPVQALMRVPFMPGQRGLRDEVVAEGRTDAQGRFHLKIAPPQKSWFAEPLLLVQVVRPGHAPECVPVRVDAQGLAQADLQLRAAQPLTGKLLDQEGQPLRRAELTVVRIGEACAEPLSNATNPREKSPVPSWACQVTTDEKGLFQLPGLGGVRNVWAIVRMPGYAPQAVRFDSDSADVGEKRLTLAPVRSIRVCIREAHSDRPIPHAAVTVLVRRLAFHAHFTAWEHGVHMVHEMEPSEWDYRCDAQGELLLELPRNESVELLVTPPPLQPWLGVRKVLSRKYQGDTYPLHLPRGTWLSGTVQAEDHNHPSQPVPVPHAVVHWASLQAAKPEWTGPLLSGRDALVCCDEKGRFRIAVPPGEVVVRAYGPTPDFQAVISPTPANKRTLFAHATHRATIPEVGSPPDVTLTLRRGISTRGVALLPDGSLVKAAMLLCADLTSPVRGYSMLPFPVSEGVYTLPGSRQDASRTIYLLEPHGRLGAAVRLRGGSQGPTVCLAPCGSARVRLLQANGQPAAGAKVALELLADFNGSDLEQPVSWFDPVNHAHPRRSDQDGWVEIPALIPEARYQLRIQHETIKHLSAAFQVAADTTEHLPEIRLPAATVESLPASRNKP